jgi:hypothetical protein
MFFLYRLRFEVLTFGFALAYSVSVETKKFMESLILLKLHEWLESITPMLECSRFRGTFQLALDVDMEKHDVKLKTFVQPTSS